MKKIMKKGFTLVELIVVMAVFSLLLVGVMALTGPVSRMFSNTSLAEKTYSYANNIQIYLQGKLEYAEDIYVLTSDKINPTGVVTDVQKDALAEQFRKDHFLNTVVSKTGSSTLPLHGKIHIYRLVNKDDGEFQAGQITHRMYEFDSASPITGATLIDGSDEVSELNPTFFDNRVSPYNFSYALGSTELVVVDTPPASLGGQQGEVYRALENDFTNSLVNISASTLAVSIVIDKGNGGAIDVTSGGHTYRAFRNPVALQIANLPLTNIAFRAKNSNSGSYKGVRRPYCPDMTNTDDIKIQLDSGGAYAATPVIGNAGVAYDDAGDPSDPTKYGANKNVDFNNDIYFVCCYTDELD
ncbi:MAG: type II secretion system protein [Ruminococcus sp.]|nr:type II secretion system protein [Ruminococcus sp.]